MLRINRISLAAAVAVALAGTAASAQTVRAQTTPPGTAATTANGVTATNNGTTPASGSNLNGGCQGTNGSTCTAGTSQAPGTTTGGTTQSPTPGVTATAPAATTGTSATSSSSGTSVTGTTTVDPATTRPDSFAPGGAFGTNPGTTGNSTGTMTDANGNPINTVLPGASGALVLPVDSNGQQLSNPSTQQNVIVQQPAPVQARAQTPLFDQAALEGRAKDAKRKAQGNEPRVYGIAPRTNRDLTNQMPDDPIIRY